MFQNVLEPPNVVEVIQQTMLANKLQKQREEEEKKKPKKKRVLEIDGKEVALVEDCK